MTDAQWDAFVASTVGGSHRQTSAWGRLKAHQGWKTRRVVVSGAHRTRLAGGAQILFKPLPAIPFAGRIAYVVKGPLLAESDSSLGSRLLDEIDRVCRDERIRAVMVQPPEDAPPIESLLTAHGYLPSPVALAPPATVVVDLDADVDVLWSRLSRQLRKNIRRAETRGVVVRPGERVDLGDFHRLLTAASERLGYPISPRAYYEQLWE
ncbi:MAG TPA: peptidoglycan bridge formation glycyltransferase FemA/FemB family protein, partial [Euzebyales bacterium]|nr:peptidoglycan bridge formation glycyltransferase FemA/FemB family protein [Euzebyales bacterium]